MPEPYIRQRMSPFAALCLGLAALGAAASTLAAEPQRARLVAYSDESGGAALGAGDYDTAVTILAEAQPPVTTDTALATNRCVAFTVKGLIEAARMACDMAVSAAQRDRHWPPAGREARNDLRSAIARAYSNRAVLEWLSGDLAAAKRDLATAQELAPAANYVAANGAALRLPNSTATAILALTVK